MSDSTHADRIQDLLNRMRKAHDRGTGCHLSASDIEDLSLTIVGEIWSEPDPRVETKEREGGTG